MGYSICLARNDNPITLDEWLSVINNDKELKLVESIEAINPITKQRMKIEIYGHTVWNCSSEDYNAEFYYRNGKVCTDYYDKVIMNKMRSLAKELHAIIMDEFDEEM